MRSVLLLSFPTLLALGCLTDGCLALWTSCRCPITAVDQCTAFTSQLSELHLLRKAASSCGRGFRSYWRLSLGGLSPFPWGSVFLQTGNQGFLKQNAITPRWLFHAFWKSKDHSFHGQLFTHVKNLSKSRNPTWVFSPDTNVHMSCQYGIYWKNQAWSSDAPLSLSGAPLSPLNR